MRQDPSSSFVTLQLTEAEFRAAFTYNEAQRAGIQNEIAAAAEECLQSPLDEDDSSIPAIKRRAYNQGRIAFGKYLLSLHDSLNNSQSTEGN